AHRMPNSGTRYVTAAAREHARQMLAAPKGPAATKGGERRRRRPS
ncbi:MAG: hypothetical protein JSR54_13335, partial [Proteobacteria bacterium]|nr:hypothetical protein [Pseudomonadota bacterium]